MRAILALTGVELEARALARAVELPRLPSLPFAAYGTSTIRVAHVGLGAARLESLWPSLLAGLDDPLVVSAGVCGALDPALGPGDLIVPESVIGPDGARMRVGPSGHRAAVLAAPAAVTAPMVTARTVVATRAAKAEAFARTGAVAVDMESSLIVARAAADGLPSLVVRGVSDTATHDVPAELLALVTPEGRLRVAGAIGLIRRPALLPRALELRRATRRALGAVAALLACLAAGAEIAGARPSR